MMTLVITVRKEVANQTQGEDLFVLIKERLEDRPDLTLTGHVTNHFVDEEPPE